jgi:hypothetical protein
MMPRLQMFLVAAATSMAGFLTTLTLLLLHVETMWLRYGLAVVVAYGVFLILIHEWIKDYRENGEKMPLLRMMRRTEPRSGFSWRDLLDFGDVLDVFDFGGILSAIVIVFFLVLVLYYIASAAILIPEWIAELVVDGAIGATVYRQLRPNPIRRTVARSSVC